MDGRGLSPSGTSDQRGPEQGKEEEKRPWPAGWAGQAGPTSSLTFEKEVEQHPKDLNLVLNWSRGQGDPVQAPCPPGQGRRDF